MEKVDLKKEFKWQNLIERRCPRCGEELQAKETKTKMWFNCMNRECMFGISADRIVEKLSDPRHPINKYATQYQIVAVREAFKRAMN